MQQKNNYFQVKNVSVRVQLIFKAILIIRGKRKRKLKEEGKRKGIKYYQNIRGNKYNPKYDVKAVEFAMLS